ncbi:sugar transferase [Ligilactobacillus sp. LYQ135]
MEKEKIMATISESTINSTNAGSKAKDDIIKISQGAGFKQLILTNPRSHVDKLKFLAKSYTGALKSTYQTNADLIIFQYAGYFNFTTDISLRQFRKYNRSTPIYLLIHDVSYLRSQLDKDWQREFKLFNAADGLIVHNDKMKTWLGEHGISVPMITLEIFDYLTNQAENDNEFNKHVVFAGNLAKSTFLSKLAINTPVDLFGPKPLENYPTNITYKGIKKPDELAKYLDQSFGLVWDGDSIHECSGKLGNYERFNNPHKVSLYLSAGLPVIVWKQAAMADFVTNHNVGIVIDDLAHLDEAINQLSEDDYAKMKKNVHLISQKLRTGQYTLEALNKVEI